MNFDETLKMFVIGVIVTVGLIYLGIIGAVFIVVLVDAVWSWLRTWAYYRVEMLGSSTRGQLRSVLYKMFYHLIEYKVSYGGLDQADEMICVIDHGKFSDIVRAYDRVFFWRVKDGEKLKVPGISSLSKSNVLVIIDNASHLSDRHVSQLTKALHSVDSIERIDLMLPYGQDPTCFLEEGFPPPCFRCSAAKANLAFKGEHGNAKDTYILDSYHIAHAGSTVTAMVVYDKEHYGTKFVGVTMNRTCCASTPTLQDKPRLRRNSAPNLDVFTFLPRVDVDLCALASKTWRATLVHYCKSLTLHPLRQFTIYRDGSSRCAYKLADERLMFRASATVMLDAMRNAHIENLRVEHARGDFLIELSDFITDSNVTSVETTLTLPTFLPTTGVKTTQASPLILGKMIKQLKSEGLAVTFDAEERDFSVLGLEHLRQHLRDLRIVITNNHLPSLELARLIFSQRSANVHLTLSTPPSAHFLATFLDDVLKQCAYEDLHQMTILKVAVQKETVYDTPPWLQFIKELDLSDDLLRQHLACAFHLRAMQCRVYELHRQKADTYTIIISCEPESPQTNGNCALQVVIVPVKITFPGM